MKLVKGWGINDANYPVTRRRYEDYKVVDVWVCQYYQKWSSMIDRVHDQRGGRYKSYKDCIIDGNWQKFSSFKSWMEKQDWVGNELDKDLFGDGKTYNQESCCFIPPKLNRFLETSNKSRGSYPIGVSLHESGKFHACCGNPFNRKKRFYLGLHDTPEVAHSAWLKKKLEVGVELCDTLGVSVEIKEAVIRRYT